MHATLDLEDDLLGRARELAARRAVSLDAVVNDLLGRAIRPGVVVDADLDLPVFTVPAGTPPVDPAKVRDALDEGV